MTIENNLQIPEKTTFDQSAGEFKQHTYRRTAVLAGVLFIIATAFLFIGKAFYEPILGAPDYLEIAYPERRIVVLGILLEFACVIAIPLIPVVLFPVLKKFGEALALGYVVFRLLEAVLFVGVEIRDISQISVSQGYLNAGGIDSAFFENLGSAMQAANLWAFSIYVLVFAIGALMFYAVLYRSQLVPRFLPVWGFLAAVIMLVGTILTMLEMISGNSILAQLIIAAPIAVNEMVLAIWLIVKGFSPSALEPRLA